LISKKKKNILYSLFSVPDMIQKQYLHLKLDSKDVKEFLLPTKRSALGKIL